MLLNVLRYPGRCRTASRQTAPSRTPACQGRETALFKVPVGGGVSVITVSREVCARTCGRTRARGDRDRYGRLYLFLGVFLFIIYLFFKTVCFKCVMQSLKSYKYNKYIKNTVATMYTVVTIYSTEKIQ